MIIDQRLIEYIKKEILNGIHLGEIKNKLVDVGWERKEISEALQLAKKQMPSTSLQIYNLNRYKTIEEQNFENKPKIIIVLIMGIVFVIFCIASITTYFILGEKKSEYAGSSPLTDEKDCGDNFDCFIKSSIDCKLAKVIYVYIADVSGIKKTTTMEYELKGLEANKCIFYMKTKSIDIKYSEQFIQQMKDSGISQDAIIKKEQVENIKADSSEGKEVTCKITSIDLTETLNIWKSNSLQVGTFSDKIWKYAECKGNYFS